jgi:hypothetical protein
MQPQYEFKEYRKVVKNANDSSDSDLADADESIPIRYTAQRVSGTIKQLC